MSDQEEAHNADLFELCYEIGYRRAKFDKMTLGHYQNKYPEGSGEHKGYAAFMAAVLARVAA